MRVATRVDELLEQALKATQILVLALLGYSGHELGKESEIFSEFGASEAEEESLVIGDNLLDTLERKRVVVDASYVFV